MTVTYKGKPSGQTDSDIYRIAEVAGFEFVCSGYDVKKDVRKLVFEKI